METKKQAEIPLLLVDIEGKEKREKYWEEKLKGYQRTPLPYHKVSVPELDLNRRMSHIISLDKSLTEALQIETEKKGIPAKIFFLSTLCYCLQLTTNTNDLTIGIGLNTLSDLGESEKGLSFFSNAIPFRVIVPLKVNGEDLVKKIHYEFKELKCNGELTLLDAIKAWNEPTNVQNPFFDIVVSYSDSHIVREEGELALDEALITKGNASILLDVEITNENGHFKIFFFYPEELFNSGEMEKFGLYFISALKEIVLVPHEPVNRNSVLGGKEVDIILNEFSCGPVRQLADFNFIELFENQVLQTPSRLAISCNEKTSSYDSLNRKTNRLARYISNQLELRRDDLVIIMLDRSETAIECILSIWKAGAAYIPAEPTTPENRMLSIIRRSGARMLITHSSIVTPDLERLIAPLLTIVCVDKIEGALQFESFKNLERPIRPHDLAYVIYTSGSTGEPKGVMVEHTGMLNHMYAKIHDLKINAESLVVQNASLCFDISVWQMFAALLQGGQTVIYDQEIVHSPEFFIEKLNADKVTILEVVPSYLTLLLDRIKPEDVLDDLEYLLVTGETVQPVLVARWFEKFPKIKMVNAYGPTEASDDITHFIMESMPSTSTIPVGRPIQNLRIYIVDGAMQLCPIGVKGELCVSGVGVGRGYINDLEKTTKVFMKDPFSDKEVRLYKTGDIGKFLNDGNIEFYGRNDGQIKIQGNRVELSEIEFSLMKFKGITSAVVLDFEDHLGAKYLKAYITVDHHAPEPKLILRNLRNQLPVYMIPSKLIVLDKLPLTANGKIDRKALS